MAKGKTVPPAADVKRVESQICSDPRSAAKELTKAIQAGGSHAQLWVYSLFDADCTDPSAVADTYQVGSWKPCLACRPAGARYTGSSGAGSFTAANHLLHLWTLTAQKCSRQSNPTHPACILLPRGPAAVQH